jgi:iron complex transport system permease protein
MSRGLRLGLMGLVVLAVAGLLSLSVGAVAIAPTRWMGLLWESELSVTERTILWELRLPRILTGGLVGGALACAGIGFQGLFRNSLAEPYVIGASSGAALGVTIVVVLGARAGLLGMGATSVAAMIGSLLIVSLVLLIGSTVPTSSTLTLLLAGVAISSLVNAIVSTLMMLNDQKAVVVLSWLMGSLATSHWGTVMTGTCVGIPGMVGLWFLSRALDAYTLGDVTARSLGLDPRRFRMLLIGSASISTASAVSSAGIVGFVGLISPHIARRIVGGKHAALIPLSACVGGTLMILADGVARTIIAPAELPVGIVTALVGGPFFLWLLLGRQSLDCAPGARVPSARVPGAKG